MAEHFNHYFAFVFARDKSLASTISGGSMTKIHNYLSEGGNTCSELTLDISIVRKAISRLRADKSMGPDVLAPKLLIETQELIAYP